MPPTERIARAPEGKAALADPDALDLPRNERLFEQYTIYSKIGDGGMGVVYLARDRHLGRFVAIKRLNTQAQSSPALRQRFLHEARAVAALSHVHIIHIYALGEDEDGPYMVMEYIAGPDDPEIQKERQDGGLVQPNHPLTLDQYVARHGQYTADDAVALVVKIARSVAYAHSCGVIHRDLKPSNILLDKTNEPKIVDFGLARLMHKEESKLTVPGEKLLSLGYGAPEQESDASLSDERADVYGLGALLYFVLTGQNPRYFREQDLPVPLREAVVKALATDKEQRWPSAQAFADELGNIQSKTRIELPTVKTTWRCKWCDAVNPLSLKYCAECGWDGSEICPECGSDTFVGVQYCGSCGADARAYEMVLAVLKKMREVTAQRRFTSVNLFAGRIHGFEPAGPEGRKLINEIADLRAEAEKSIQRRTQLKDQIPMEIRAENYERAALFIKQHRELSEDQHAFAHEAQQLPEMILKRDLQRADQALRHRDWQTASRICDELLATVAPNNPECRQIRKRIRLHQTCSQCLGAAAIALIIALMYLGTLPYAAYRLQGTSSRVPSRLYRPGAWLYDQSPLAPLLRPYANRWLPADATLAGCLKPRDDASSALAPTGADQASDELEQKRQEYTRHVEDYEATQKTDLALWPKEYLRELDDLIERRRTLADYSGWENASAERKRFIDTQEIGEMIDDDDTLSDLTRLKSKYRQTLASIKLAHSRALLTLSKNYINDLTKTRASYMQDGKMDLATAVNAEISRVRSLPHYLAAEAVLADSENVSAIGSTSTNEDSVKELAGLREAFERELAEAELAANQNVTQWPEKYTAELTDLMDTFQRELDYFGWESVREEMVRFDADRTLQPRHFITQPLALATLQRKYYQMKNDMRRNKAEQIVSTTEKYAKDLLELQKKLMVDKQMEAAALVQAEMKRVRSRIDYIDAQNLLAPPAAPATDPPQ